jgi:hypothetical protein
VVGSPGEMVVDRAAREVRDLYLAREGGDDRLRASGAGAENERRCQRPECGDPSPGPAPGGRAWASRNQQARRQKVLIHGRGGATQNIW